MELDLNSDTTVKLDGSGNGTAKLGPSSSGETWNMTLASVKVSSNTAEATCKLYIGDRVSDNNFADGTFSGSSGDSSDRVTQPLRLGTYIFAVWAGGDANAVGTINVTGTRTIPG